MMFITDSIPQWCEAKAGVGHFGANSHQLSSTSFPNYHTHGSLASFELTQGNKTIYLDAFYGPFAAMLWLVTHVQEMEHSRIAHFLSTSDANSTLSVIMQEYEKTLTAEQDDLQNLYYNAYRIVWDVLQASREQIQSNVYKTAAK